mmetsp:Transcript_48371/g.128324  ORF Transcript_48371/g.128324 Transcript_48371/m.128324 type:complete len:118 (+) Transcript_48371:703-1056(+)
MIEAALDCLDSYEDKSSLVQVSEGSGNASQLQTVGRNEFVAVFKAIAGLVLTIIKKSAMLVGWVIQELGNLFKKKAAPSLTFSVRFAKKWATASSADRQRMACVVKSWMGGDLRRCR